MERDVSTEAVSGAIYRHLGTVPVINACGIYTDMGGVVLSEGVWNAMAEANETFVDMVDLLSVSGAMVASMLGAEAARITPGASAAIALGTAACMTGADGAKMERLPDTTDMRSEIVIQARHRYKYDRMIRMTGARLTEAGDAKGTTSSDLDQAIGPATAAVFYPAHLDGAVGTVGLGEAADIAHRHGIPLLVDAAYLNYPTEIMGGFIESGADLVCFSAKYFLGPNSGGLIVGRKDLIEAVAGVDFTRYESGQWLVFGRPFKLDRQIIVGTVVALQEWLAMDHGARFAAYSRSVAEISDGIADIAGISSTPMFFTMQETYEPEPTNCLAIHVKPDSGLTSTGVATLLRSGDPSVRVIVEDQGITVVVETLSDEDVPLVINRLRAGLVSSTQHAPRVG